MKNRHQFQEHTPKYGRQINRFAIRQKILIVCEGEKTEPLYFRKFPIAPNSIIDVHGVGANTISLVKIAIERNKSNKYNQVWCVFDRDSFPAQNFNAAIHLARENGIKIAYSNEAFELWYVLHFCYLNTGITRQDYITRLEKFLGHEYKKNSENIYSEVLGLQKKAIQNASKLLEEYDPLSPEQSNPSTTVHLLVEQLNQAFWN